MSWGALSHLTPEHLATGVGWVMEAQGQGFGGLSSGLYGGEQWHMPSGWGTRMEDKEPTSTCAAGKRDRTGLDVGPALPKVMGGLSVM